MTSFGPPAVRRLHTAASRVSRSSGRLAGGVRMMLSAVAGASVLGLIAFHVAIFWDQIADGRLLDPSVALRWALGGLLLVAIGALRRAGVPLLWGRRALVVWVLVALLHWNTAAASEAGGADPRTTAILLELPTSVGATLLLGAVLLLALVRRGRLRHAALRARAVRRPRSIRLHSPLVSPHLASRAPPRLA